MKILGLLVLVLLAFAGAWILLAPQPPPQPPRIVTVYDTVQTLDTVWRERIRQVAMAQETLRVNILETLLVTVPETLMVRDTLRLAGVDALEIGQVGAQSRVEGFTVQSQGDTALTRVRWRYTYWTPGPLLGLVMGDTAPLLLWGEPPVVRQWPRLLGGSLLGTPLTLLGGFVACRLLGG